MTKEIRCNGCKLHPDQIDEYVSQFVEFDCSSPEDMVRQEEGTFNPDNGHFWCTNCYIKAGTPLGVAR